MLPVIFNSLDTVGRSEGVNALLAVARKEGGLVLTQEDARSIMEARGHTLEELGRLDLSIDVSAALLKKLIKSPFAQQKSLVETASSLYEIFHFIKNETSDFVSDEDIISAMMKLFNGSCGGSAELLAGRGAEKIIENFNVGRELDDSTKETEPDEEDCAQ